MANPEILSLVEKWLAEVCSQTLDMKSVHVVTKLAELSVLTYHDKHEACCHPSRSYLGQLVNWSVSKISRLTSKLKEWGLLTKTQPRIHDKATNTWQTLTTIYILTFLTPARIKELASVFGITLARMKDSFSQKEEKKKHSCVQPVRKVAAIVGTVARQVYERVMAVGKGSEESKVEIKTGNVTRDAMLNRSAKLGKEQGNNVLTQAA